MKLHHPVSDEELDVCLRQLTGEVAAAAPPAQRWEQNVTVPVPERTSRRSRGVLVGVALCVLAGVGSLIVVARRDRNALSTTRPVVSGVVDSDDGNTWLLPTHIPDGLEFDVAWLDANGAFQIVEYVDPASDRELHIRSSTLPMGLPNPIGSVTINSQVWQVAQLRLEDGTVFHTTLFHTDGTNEVLVNGRRLDFAEVEMIVSSLDQVPQQDLPKEPDISGTVNPPDTQG